MLVKLNFHQSKYLILIAFIAILSQPLSAAKSCDYKMFNIKTAEKITHIELLTQIAHNCNFSIIIKDATASTLIQNELYGINIKDLSLDEIFEVLISDNDLYYEYDKNFLRISALKTKTFKVDYVTSVRQGTANLNASVDAIITEGDTGRGAASGGGDHTVNSVETFDFWSTIQAEVISLMNTGAEEYIANTPIVNQNAGLITVTGTKEQLLRVENYLKKMQKSLHKQVLIDVTILAVNLEEGHEQGVNWSKFDLTLGSKTAANDTAGWVNDTAGWVSSGASTVSIVNDAVFTMTGLIDFLNANGDTQVISSPKVLSMNNQQALITIGDNINYRVRSTENSADNTGTVSESFDNFSIFIGVLLNITPQITNSNEIILRINPAVSNFKYSDDDGKQITPREIAPDTSEKKLSTIVKVKNGNTVILGGLITHGETNDKTSVPLLSSIPLLGGAFRHEEQRKITSELIFVITPRIIGPKDNTRATLKDLGFSKRVYEQ